MTNPNQIVETREQAHEIVLLQDKIVGLAQWVDPTDAHAIQRCTDERLELRSRLIPLQSRRSYLAAEWNRLAGEVDGYQRALELLWTLRGDGDATPLQPTGSRIRRHLELRASEAVDFRGDLTLVDEKIAITDIEILAVQANLLSALQKVVGAAEAEKAASHARRSNARRRRIEVLMTVDPTVMWSPSPVIGYRVWRLSRAGFIGSASPWPTSTFTATCALDDDVPHTDGRCAGVAFGCGVYAAKDVRELIADFDVAGRSNVAVGLVIMTGKVVEHQWGYRAETTQVVSLAFLDAEWLTFVEGKVGVAEAFASSGNTMGTVGYKEKRPTGKDQVEEMLVRFFDNEARGTETWTLETNKE